MNDEHDSSDPVEGFRPDVGLEMSGDIGKQAIRVRPFMRNRVIYFVSTVVFVSVFGWLGEASWALMLLLFPFLLAIVALWSFENKIAFTPKAISVDTHVLETSVAKNHLWSLLVPISTLRGVSHHPVMLGMVWEVRLLTEEKIFRILVGTRADAASLVSWLQRCMDRTERTVVSTSPELENLMRRAVRVNQQSESGDCVDNREN